MFKIITNNIIIKNISYFILIFLLFNFLSCYTYKPLYDTKYEKNDSIEFKNPKYENNLNGTGWLLFGGMTVAIGTYSYFNPWYKMQNDQGQMENSPIVSSIVGMSGSIIFSILFKLIFYGDGIVKTGDEIDWLNVVDNNLKYIRSDYGKPRYISESMGNKRTICEVNSIYAQKLNNTMVNTTNQNTPTKVGKSSSANFIENNSGTWKGTGTQINNNSKWDIEIKIINEKQITISYPTLRCGGNLKLIKQSDVSAELEELIEYGKDKCLNNGKINLTNERWSAIQFKYYYKDGKYGAYGQLFKEKDEQISEKNKNKTDDDNNINVNIFQNPRILNQPELTSFDISPDSKYIVTSSEDKTIKLWNITNGEILYTLFETTYSPIAVCFSSDGKSIYSATKRHILNRWDANKASFINQIISFESWWDKINVISCSNNGKYINVGFKNGFYIKDIENGQLINSNIKSSVYNIDINSVTNHIVLACDKDIKLLDLPNLNVYRTFKSSNYPSDVKFTPDGNFIINSSNYSNEINLWRISNQQIVNVIKTEYENNTSIDISPDGKYLVISSLDGRVKVRGNEIIIFNLTNNKKIISFKGDGNIKKIRFSPNGKYLAAEFDDFLNIWDVSSLNIKPSESVTVGPTLIPYPETPKESDIDTEIPLTNIKQTNTYALIIGNEDYTIHQKNLSTEDNVTYAIKDAELFRKYCINTLGIPVENISLLRNEISTKMKQEIRNFSNIPLYKQDEEVKLLFYYVGHGAPDFTNNNESYILPIDVSEANIYDGIQLSQLYKDLTENSPIRVTAFIDACFSKGLIASRGVRVQPKPNTLFGNIIVFNAVSGSQKALPYDDKQHGLFTYYLLKKIKDSKGDINYGELSDYIKENVSLQANKLHYMEQNPSTDASIPLKPFFWRSFKLK